MFQKNPSLQLSTVTVALLALTLVFTSAMATTPPDHPKATGTSTVIEVHDGDTIKLASGMEVRYLTETHHPKKPVEYFEFKTSEFNKKLVGEEKVKLEYDVEEKDQYGRHLAYVYVKQDNEWIIVNAELLREGYAPVYTLPPNVKHSDYLLELEQNTRKNCRGLWQAYCEGPPVFSVDEIEGKMDEYLGEVVTVGHRVTRTYDSDNVIFLNSSDNYDTNTKQLYLRTAKTYTREV